MYSIVTHMSLVCHPYATRMYPHFIRMSVVCTLISPVCHLYVLECHSYVTHMYLYVIRMSLDCGFAIKLLNKLLSKKFIERCTLILSYIPRCARILKRNSSQYFHDTTKFLFTKQDVK